MQKNTVRVHTHLSELYKGTLLAACVLDVNNHLFNFAYGIVCGEKIEEREWFLEIVAECLVGSCNRKKPQTQGTKSQRCSQCSKVGHTRLICHNPCANFDASYEDNVEYLLDGSYVLYKSKTRGSPLHHVHFNDFTL